LSLSTSWNQTSRQVVGTGHITDLKMLGHPNKPTGDSSLHLTSNRMRVFKRIRILPLTCSGWNPNWESRYQNSNKPPDCSTRLQENDCSGADYRAMALAFRALVSAIPCSITMAEPSQPLCLFGSSRQVLQLTKSSKIFQDIQTC
jgi:hypothetical protein